MPYPSHIVAARKVICAVVTSLANKWFVPLMWAEDDPQELKDQTMAMNLYAKACIRLATTLKLAPVSQIAIKRQDSFIRKYTDDLLKLKSERELQTKRAIMLLEVSNICQCNVVAITQDKSEWRQLYDTTRELLERYFYPFFPSIEDEGMELYSQMCNSKA